MEEPVKGSGGHDRVVGKNVTPLTERLVAGKDDGLLFIIAFADDLKEQAGFFGFELQITDFINNQQCGVDQMTHDPMEAIFMDSFGQLANEIDGTGEDDPVLSKNSSGPESN